MITTRALDTLLVFNLATDADDPILGFTTNWINRLATHVRALDVITMRAGRLEVADNVRVFSVGKEDDLSESQRAVVFYQLLSTCVRERTRENGRGYDACFAHMMPLFAAMSAPLLIPRRIPITLWYTHRQISRTLQIATRVSHRIVTAVPDSFPIPTPKKQTSCSLQNRKHHEPTRQSEFRRVVNIRVPKRQRRSESGRRCRLIRTAMMTRSQPSQMPPSNW